MTGMLNALANARSARARVAVDHAAARIDQRPFALAEHREELRAAGRRDERLALDGCEPMPVAADRQVAVAMERAAASSARLSARRSTTGPGRPVRAISNAVRIVASSSQRIGHEEHVLRDGAHDVGDRRFLERVGADRGASRPGRRSRRSESSRPCSRARASRSWSRPGPDVTMHDADLAARARVTCRHESRALLVRRHDQRHRLGAVARVPAL